MYWRLWAILVGYDGFDCNIYILCTHMSYETCVITKALAGIGRYTIEKDVARAWGNEREQCG